ncbi:MAG: enoyl-CoA hydratase/isomerase family protein [Deltaproteobacteria bacterium]|nr:enoyl-CoA hydratase/isomerase family protein [Deltaproteobacteria bacterium]
MSIRLVRDGVVAVLVLDRPERANAYDDALLAEFEAALDAALVDPGVGALVVEAAGDRAFCGGADLAGVEAAAPLDALDLRSQRVFDRIARAPLVSVAAIHGPAVAGGFELALACDLRVASPAARFSLPETGLGILPSAGGCTRLARMVGPARAKAVILGGIELDAATALDWGLVDRVVPDPRAEARAWAARIASRDRVALRLAKQVIDLPDTGASLQAERVAEALLYARRSTTR